MANVAREERWGDRTSVEERRNEILRKLGMALRDRGFASMKMQDIADLLNMTKGNLYYYFPSKQDLLFHGHMKCMAISLAALTDAQQAVPPYARILQTLLHRHIAGILEEANGAVLLTDLEDLTPAHRTEYVALRDRFEKGVRAILVAGIAAGEFRDTDPSVATFAMLGGVNWMPKWFRPGGRWTPQDAAERFSAFFLQSVLAA
jgi:AcrR family transcriptional regulator